MPSSRHAPHVPKARASGEAMDSELIAVLDLGKTHAKILLLDALSGAVISERVRVCAPVPGPYFRELDIAQTESWLFETLASESQRSRIRHIVPIAHGAAAVLIDKRGHTLAAPDYEDPVFEVASPAYALLRDRFTETYSPALPLGLNLGLQWYFLQSRHHPIWERTHWALLHPQYWAWKFSGVAASEITSLGCHSDLWRPLPSCHSDLVLRQGWDRILPPLRFAGEVLGPITPAIAQVTGLSAQCRVYCGLHDSNASYLCHLAEFGAQHTKESSQVSTPFSVISSGTWTIVLAQGAPLTNLRPHLDMLANIDAYGHPVATARFMGGREFAQIAGPEGRDLSPDQEILANLLTKQAMALPPLHRRAAPSQATRDHWFTQIRLQRPPNALHSRSCIPP